MSKILLDIARQRFEQEPSYAESISSKAISIAGKGRFVDKLT